MFKKVVVLAFAGLCLIAANSIACEGPECVDLWTDGGVDQSQHEGSTFVPLNNGGTLSNIASQDLGMWANIGGSRGGDREGTVDVIARQGQTLETKKLIVGGDLFTRSDEFQEGTLNLEGVRGAAWGDASTDAIGRVDASGGEHGDFFSMGSLNDNRVNADAVLCTTRGGSGTLDVDALNENGHDQVLNTPDSSGRTFSYTGVRETISLKIGQ